MHFVYACLRYTHQIFKMLVTCDHCSSQFQATHLYSQSRHLIKKMLELKDLLVLLFVAQKGVLVNWHLVPQVPRNSQLVQQRSLRYIKRYDLLRFHVAHLIKISRDNFSRQIYFFQLVSHIRRAMFNCLCYQARMLKFKCLICSQINVGSIGKIQKLRVIHAEHEDETGWHLNEASLIFMILPYNF